MKLSNRAQSILCFLAGLGIAFAAIYPIAATSAIAPPDGFLPWFRAMGAPGLGLFVWDALVVHGLGIGVLALLALLALYRGPADPTARSAGLYVAGALGAFHLLMPLVHHTPLALAVERHWWNYSLEFVLVVAAALAAFVARAGAAKAARYDGAEAS